MPTAEQLTANNKRRESFQLICKEKSRTHQSFANEANINTIMSRYETTGVIENLNKNPPQFGDVSQVPDYQTACNMIMAAEATFGQLPASVRKKFENNPGLFLEFTQNPENINEMVDMGLLDESHYQPPIEPATAPTAPEIPLETEV